MNYVFLDTSSWINFACGKNDKLSFDFTDNNRRVLDSLIELTEAKVIVLLKNEIIDLEFKEALIEPLVEAYEEKVLKHFKSLLHAKVIPHCENQKQRKVFKEALINVDEVLDSFKERSKIFNEDVLNLFNSAVPINVSEPLKQRALQNSISKEHPMFVNRQNNVNDFLILYSIQEWIDSRSELRGLDETSHKHAIFFVTKNYKDFGIKNSVFSEKLAVSQLIKPIENISALVSTINIRKNEREGSADFLPSYTNSTVENTDYASPSDVVIDKLNKLIELKKEFLLLFMRRKISDIPNASKLKYVGRFVKPTNDKGIEEDFPIVRSQNIRDFKLDPNNLLVGESTDLVTRSMKGDILIKSFGERVGEHCVNDLDDGIYVHHSLYVLRIDQNKVIPQFLDYFLRCHDLNDYSKGSVIPKLSTADLKKIKVNLPPLEQQQSLIKLIQQKEQEIENDLLKIKGKIRMLLM